jgi:hypothetical protein
MFTRIFVAALLICVSTSATYYAYHLGKSEQNTTTLNTDNNAICGSYPWVKEAFIRQPLCHNWEGKVLCMNRYNNEDNWVEMEFTRNSKEFVASFSVGGEFLELTERIHLDELIKEIPPAVLSQLHTECKGSVMLSAEREQMADETILFDFDICQPTGLNYHITYDNQGIRVKNRYENDLVDGPCNCDKQYRLGNFPLTKRAASNHTMVD